VREALQDVTQTASGAAREAHHESQQYLRQARERYPEAAQYYQEGHRAISQRTAENPRMSLLLAAADGYVLAWMIQGQRRARGRHVPDYSRINQSYIPCPDEPRVR
jgi:ElaB/YqjD/DUF883 family membrane-anchored ribosome-binding protein